MVMIDAEKTKLSQQNATPMPGQQDPQSQPTLPPPVYTETPTTPADSPPGLAGNGAPTAPGSSHQQSFNSAFPNGPMTAADGPHQHHQHSQIEMSQIPSTPTFSRQPSGSLPMPQPTVPRSNEHRQQQYMSPNGQGSPSAASPGQSRMPSSQYQHPMQPQPPQQQHTASAADVGREYQAQLFARCAAGDHDTSRKFGMCGILTAIFCFPIGLICLFTDSEERCERCNVRIQ